MHEELIVAIACPRLMSLQRVSQYPSVCRLVIGILLIVEVDRLPGHSKYQCRRSSIVVIAQAGDVTQ